MDRSKTRLSTGGTVKQLLLYFLLFLAGDLLSSIAFDLLFSLIPLRARWMYLLLRSLGALGLTWLLFWLYTTHVLGRAMADFGVTLSVRGWAAAAAVLLPAGVTAVYGSLVGIMFSLAADRGGSVGSSAVIHTVWNLVMVTDILHITTAQGAYGSPLLSVVIPWENVLLTGGDFGVEASVISAAGYGAVCCAVLLAGKKGNKPHL